MHRTTKFGTTKQVRRATLAGLAALVTAAMAFVTPLNAVAVPGALTFHTTDVAAPDGGKAVFLTAVSCVTGGNCTAVGRYNDGSTGAQEIMAVIGSAGNLTTTVPLAPPTGASNPSLTGVSCAAAGECTAVGTDLDSQGHQALLDVTETGGVWQQASQIALPVGTTYPALAGVSCVSAENCTAVGEYDDLSLQQDAFAIAQTAGSWGTPVVVAVASGTAQYPYISSVSCQSMDSCTGVGTYDDQGFSRHAFAVTETDGSWSTGKNLPAPSSGTDAGLNAVDCVSASDCTAVGGYFDGPKVGVMAIAKSNGVWRAAKALDESAVTSPILNDVSCTTAGNCTLVGRALDQTDANPSSFYIRKSGGVWGSLTAIPSPFIGNDGQLMSISCTNSADCTGVGEFTSAGDQYGLVASTSQPPPAIQPTVTNVSPGKGATNLNTTFTVRGTGFISGETVTIGQGPGVRRIKAAGVVVDSSSKLTATAPAGGTLGVFRVRVSGAGFTSVATRAATFHYIPEQPVVASLTPNTGANSVANPIQIDGSGFTPDATVTIGQGGTQPALVATGITVVSPTEIDATIPAGGRFGTYRVFVHEAVGTSISTGADRFRFTATPGVELRARR